MLVLSRGPKDKVLFPNLGISVEILRISGSRVRIGVEAPKDVRVLRHELEDMQNSSDPEGSAEQERELSHRLRNRLNTAHLSLSLMEKQLDAGMHEEALLTLHRALREFDAVDGSMSKPETTASERPLRALLVEDDANESELLAGYLRMSGFDVDTAEDGLQAMVQLARRDRPDVVLLDMHMPRMNGAKTVESIRLNPDYEGVRVYAVTGSLPEDLGVPIGPQGVDRWFRKPIKPQELVESMHQELRPIPFRSPVTSG